MPVYLAKSAGFCFGVNNAVNRVHELLDSGESVSTLGPIIHNPQVVEELSARGVTTVSDPADTPDGDVLVIRSHGVPQSVYDAIEEKDCAIAMPPAPLWPRSTASWRSTPPTVPRCSSPATPTTPRCWASAVIATVTCTYSAPPRSWSSC